MTLLPKKSRGEEVHLTLTLRYGNEENLKGLKPAAGFLSELMLRGTKKLRYQQLRDELDRLRATLGAGGGRRTARRRSAVVAAGAAGWARVSFSIQAKRDTLPEVLELLRQVLREPRLPAERVRGDEARAAGHDGADANRAGHARAAAVCSGS